MVVKARNEAARQVELAAEDGYKRLLAPSMETETRQEAKKRADEEALRVFAENLRELLLAAPLGRKRVLALDRASAQAQNSSASMLKGSCSITTQFTHPNLQRWWSKQPRR